VLRLLPQHRDEKRIQVQPVVVIHHICGNVKPHSEATRSGYFIPLRARAIQMFPVVSARLNNRPSLVTDNPTLPGLPKLVNDCCDRWK
jgi:hypothetical protein